MDKNFQDIEAQLESLRPSSLSPDLLRKLEGAMSNCIDLAEIREVETELAELAPTDLSEDQFEQIVGRMELSPVESALEQLSPATLNSDLLARLTGVMDGASSMPSVIEEKVVDISSSKERVVNFFPWAGAAAAVVIALIGLVSFSGAGKTTSGGLATGESKDSSGASPYHVSSEPVSQGEISNHLLDVSNEGVFLDNEGQPVRKMKILMEERYKVEQTDGKVIELWQPKERVIYLPVEIE